MSVLIKGMKMPDGCYNCPLFRIVSTQKTITAIPLIQYTKAFCLALKTEFLNETNIAVRPSDCPLIEVPPHGRLIDADALKLTAFAYSNNFIHKMMVFGGQMVYSESAIDDAPTIIEGET